MKQPAADTRAFVTRPGRLLLVRPSHVRAKGTCAGKAAAKLSDLKNQAPKPAAHLKGESGETSGAQVDIRGTAALVFQHCFVFKREAQTPTTPLITGSLLLTVLRCCASSQASRSNSTCRRARRESDSLLQSHRLDNIEPDCVHCTRSLSATQIKQLFNHAHLTPPPVLSPTTRHKDQQEPRRPEHFGVSHLSSRR